MECFKYGFDFDVQKVAAHLSRKVLDVSHVIPPIKRRARRHRVRKALPSPPPRVYVMKTMTKPLFSLPLRNSFGSLDF
jgi:hypothetical protein